MAFEIKQDAFEGPLDVLLDLIEREKLAISEISLARVTDDFLLYVRMQSEKDQEGIGAFLVVAAQLMLIKSRALLPQLAVTPEEVESVEELATRLHAYRDVRRVARALSEQLKVGHRMYSRAAFLLDVPVFRPPTLLTVESLREAFERTIKTGTPIASLEEAKIRRIVSLDEKIQQIKALLEHKIERAFSDVVTAKDRGETIVSFLAILELARRHLVRLEQSEPFANISITAA